MPLTCLTWNVHRAVGRDGRRDPDRIATAIRDVFAPRRPHILALQEADEEVRPHGAILDLPAIERATGLVSVHDTPKLRWGTESHGFLGTILFLPSDWIRMHADVIDLPGHCHRGAVAVESLVNRIPLRVMSTHLSLTQPLRIAQMRILGQYLARRPDMPTILLGDLNEWRPWGGLAFAQRLVGRSLEGPARPTFPSGRPILPLDRILTDAPGGVTDLRALDDAATTMASDHRPLMGRVHINGIGSP